MVNYKIRVSGLDSIRFFSAIWVVFSHNGALPLTAGFDQTNKLSIIVNGLYTGFWSGPAAVILFFIVSGFCIHYPYANGKTFKAREFYIRRYIRIIVPMILALSIVRTTGMISDDNKDWLAGIPAWSLVAEIAYYTIYPFLSKIFNGRWTLCMVTFFILAFLFSFTANQNNLNYPAWGYCGDWIIGLPCWLMGVVLCNLYINTKKISSITSLHVWSIRVAGVVLGALTHHLKLQQILPESMTLNWFGLFAFYWIHCEIKFFQVNESNRFWEYCGTWSYSLYLTHPFSNYLFHEIFDPPNFGILNTWILNITSTLVVALIFYYSIEKPSHRFALYLSNLDTKS